MQSDAKWAWRILIACFVLTLVGAGYYLLTSYAVDRVSRSNLDTGVARITIGGMSLDIPVGYFYGEYVKRGRQWPTPSVERVAVENITMDAMLPDLSPFSAETGLWDQSSDQKLTIGISSRLHEYTIASARARSEEMVSEGLFTKNTRDGLIIYSAANVREYYPEVDRADKLRFRCHPIEGHDHFSCSGTMTLYDSISLRFYVSERHLSDWRSLALQLHDLIERLGPAVRRGPQQGYPLPLR